MKTMFWNEMPLDITSGAELRYDAMSLLLFKKFMELLDLSIGPYKISTIVTPNESGVSLTGNKTS